MTATSAEAPRPTAARAIPLRTGPAFALAALTGIVYFLGFPGVNLWPLAFIAQAPLIIALRGQAPKRAAALGLVMGTVMSIFGFYWLLEMLKVFSGFPLPLCALLALLVCAQQGGRGALCGYLHARAEARGWPAAPVFVLAFIASELAYPVLFPWFFGASVHNAPIFLQVADLGGAYLIGAVLLGTNVALAELVLARLEARPISRLTLGLGLAAPALAALYGFVQMRRIDARSAQAPAVKIGIAQGNQPLLGKTNAVETHLKLTRELRERGAELVVWSEDAVPLNFREAEYADQAKRELTGLLGVPAIVGAGIIKKSDRGHIYYNTAFFADRDGTILGRYDKHYLLAFGEYLPLGETFPILYDWSRNSGHLAPGTSLAPLVWGDHRISTIICYEDILPSFVNDVVHAGDPDLLVNITNDAWFGDTTEPWEHFALAQIRAVEHRRYLVRATNSGVSGIVDAAGRLVLHGGTFKQEALLGEARFLRAKTGYELWGDIPFWLGTIAVVAMGFVPRRKKVPATA
ncbi:MAG: apolipoprotein N-acyltransferase [Byssovorax sp.]